PALSRDIERSARESLVRDTRARLHAERPQEIKADFIEREGPAIVAAEEARFAKEDEPRLRPDIEGTARNELTGARREELRAKLRKEESIKALALAETKERFKLRIETIAENAKRTRCVPLADLLPGDVITIELTEAFTEDTELNTQDQTSGRNLRVTIDNPDEGSAYVTGDSWEKGGALQRMNAFRGGSHIVLGSALETPQGERAGAVQPALAASITYSIPLRTVVNGEDRTLPVFDVRKVSIDAEGGKTTLLDRPVADPYSQRRGY
ncbi:MAG: hypothetical protein H0W89_05470, partial [Candidatus Levybacteria bacterium]|nr:hypothetical protein [Candidatus Levybacteria bacterium]